MDIQLGEEEEEESAEKYVSLFFFSSWKSYPSSSSTSLPFETIPKGVAGLMLQFPINSPQCTFLLCQS